jgi:hypothetical protein
MNGGKVECKGDHYRKRNPSYKLLPLDELLVCLSVKIYHTNIHELFHENIHGSFDSLVRTSRRTSPGILWRRRPLKPMG